MSQLTYNVNLFINLQALQSDVAIGYKQLDDLLRYADVKYLFTFCLCLSSCTAQRIMGTDYDMGAMQLP